MTCFEKMGTENDEEPFNKISKFIETNIYKKTLMAFWKSEKIGFSQGIHKKQNFTMVESWNVRKIENIQNMV